MLTTARTKAPASHRGIERSLSESENDAACTATPSGTVSGFPFFCKFCKKGGALPHPLGHRNHRMVHVTSACHIKILLGRRPRSRRCFHPRGGHFVFFFRICEIAPPETRTHCDTGGGGGIVFRKIQAAGECSRGAGKQEHIENMYRRSTHGCSHSCDDSFPLSYKCTMNMSCPGERVCAFDFAAIPPSQGKSC